MSPREPVGALLCVFVGTLLGESASAVPQPVACPLLQRPRQTMELICADACLWILECAYSNSDLAPSDDVNEVSINSRRQA